jgi:hypothetical protein
MLAELGTWTTWPWAAPQQIAALTISTAQNRAISNHFPFAGV